MPLARAKPKSASFKIPSYNKGVKRGRKKNEGEEKRGREGRGVRRGKGGSGLRDQVFILFFFRFYLAE